VLQCVAVCKDTVHRTPSVCVAVCDKVRLDTHIDTSDTVNRDFDVHCNMLQCVAMCCSEL